MSILTNLQTLEDEILKLQANQKPEEKPDKSFHASGCPVYPTDPIRVIRQLRNEIVELYEKHIEVQGKLIDQIDNENRGY